MAWLVKHMRNGLIAIGVANCGNSWQKLPGAISGAQDMVEWGKINGYKSTLVTDEQEQVDVSRLRTSFTKLLYELEEVDRLIVYFAGHGLSNSASDQYWLLSNFASDPGEAVVVSGLRRQLAKLPILQLAIMVDACRSIDPAVIDAHGSWVLEHPVGTSDQKPQFDLFYSTTPGEPAYQFLPLNDGEQPYCVFTRALLDGLHARHDQAILHKDHPKSPAVTSGRLATFLEGEVSERAGALGIDLQPDCHPGFRFPDDVYFELAAGSPLASLGNKDTDNASTSDDSRKFGDPESSRKYGSQFSNSERTFTSTHSLQEASPRKFDPAMNAEIENIVLLAQQLSKTQKIEQSGAGPCDLAAYIAASKPRKWASLPSDGALVAFTQSNSDAFALYFDQGAQANAHLPRRATRTSILVMHQPDAWRIVQVFPYQIGVQLEMQPDQLLYLPSERLLQANEQFGRESNERFEEADLYTINLGDGVRIRDARRIADHIRFGKNWFPFRGIQAAYLYEFVHDIANVVRIAHYMDESNFGVPLDVALLCAKDIQWREDRFGRPTLFGRLDDVAETTTIPNRPSYTSCGFKAKKIKITGLLPTMRVGWDIYAHEDIEGLPQYVREASRNLRGNAHSTLSQRGADILIEGLRFSTS